MASSKTAAKSAQGPTSKDGDDPTHWDRKTHQSIADEYRSNWFSQLIYAWMGPLLWLGYSRPLQHADLGLFYYDEDTAAALCGSMYDSLLDQQKLPAGSMWMVMAHTRTWVMIGAIVSKLLGDTAGYVPFIGLQYLANYLEVRAAKAPRYISQNLHSILVSLLAETFPDIFDSSSRWNSLRSSTHLLFAGCKQWP